MQHSKPDSPTGSPRSRKPIPVTDMPPWTTGRLKTQRSIVDPLQPRLSQQTDRAADSPADLASSSMAAGHVGNEQPSQATAALRRTLSPTTFAGSPSRQVSAGAAQHLAQSSQQARSPMQRETAQVQVEAHSYNSPMQRASSNVGIPESAQLRQLTADLPDGSTPAMHGTSTSDSQTAANISVSESRSTQSPNQGTALGTNGIARLPDPPRSERKGKPQPAVPQHPALPAQQHAADLNAAVAASSNFPAHTPQQLVSQRAAAFPLPANVTASAIDSSSAVAVSPAATSPWSPTAAAPKSSRLPNKAQARRSSAPKLHDAVRARLTGSAPTSPAQLAASISQASDPASPARLRSGQVLSKQHATKLGAPKLHDAVRARLVGSAPSSPAHAARLGYRFSHANAAVATLTRPSQAASPQAHRSSNIPLGNSYMQSGGPAEPGSNDLSNGVGGTASKARLRVSNEHHTGEAQVSSAELAEHQAAAASGQVVDLWQEVRAAKHDLQRGMHRLSSMHTLSCLVLAQAMSVRVAADLLMQVRLGC